MSEEEILNIFEALNLTTEEQRRSVLFEAFQSSEETRIDVVVRNHTGEQAESPSLPHA
jgi:hypothetical protein